MILNVSPGDIAKIMSAHKAAERSKAVNGLGYLRAVQDDEPVEVIPTKVFDCEDSNNDKDGNQKDFEEFLKLIGAITMASIIDKEDDVSILERHQRKLDAHKHKRDAAMLVKILGSIVR